MKISLFKYPGERERLASRMARSAISRVRQGVQRCDEMLDVNRRVRHPV